MAWQMLWPEFLKKRLCRYLLQHYLGHFFKEKISLEQLSIDIYNGTGCVKNLNLDCDALNEQINSASSFSATSSSSSVPIEIVSGFVGYISVYIPWHDLFNDYCKLTIKNVQITIRTKQRKPAPPHQFSSSKRSNDDDDDSFYDSNQLNDEEDELNSNSMFSSMFLDSIMNTSMHIAQECLNEQDDANFGSFFAKAKSNKAKTKSEFDADSSNTGNKANNANNNSLLGLEAFASTIDSILSRIKINLEQIQIRVENLDSPSSTSTFNLAGDNIMSSSSLFSNKPSNGIALELRIKSIKYFDLDSTTQQQPTGSASNSLDPNASNPASAHPLRNTTKSFNIEGLTVYFDEFIVKDDGDEDLSSINSSKTPNRAKNSMTDSVYLNSNNSSGSNLDEAIENNNNSSASLNSTVELNDSNTTLSEPSSMQPQDESPPFNFELNPDYYLYTNPIICVTFSGTQTIKLTINNMRPTDLILEATSPIDADKLNPNKHIQEQQRPLLELSAQFGSIKCLLCPKQIHLLVDMVNKLSDYVEAANAAKKAAKLIQQKKRYLHKSKLKSSNVNKPIRGCDKRKFEALIQNDLILNSNQVYDQLDEEDLEEETTYKSLLNPHNNDNEQSVMFYSMMAESTVHSTDLGSASPSNKLNSDEHVHDKSGSSEPMNEANSNPADDEDKTQVLLTKQLKQTIEQLQNDVIVANTSKNLTSSISDSSSSSTPHNLFQTFKVTFRMLSVTVLHHDPPTPNEKLDAKPKSNFLPSSTTRRLIVDRMKPVSDMYFDWVSTIDTSSSTTSASIDKNIIQKYHQACAFHDHFLLLLKPINLNVIEKINQRNLTPSFGYHKAESKPQTIQYSFNDVTLTVGYIQLNEYLVGSPSFKAQDNAKSKFKESRGFRNQKIMEACQAASISELVYFVESSASAPIQQLEPCFKIQVVMYEPLDSAPSKPTASFGKHKSGMSSSFHSLHNDLSAQNQLLSRQFENITISLGQCLNCELDISIVDRLYYLINDVSKMGSSGPKRKQSMNKHQFQTKSAPNKPQKFQNFEIKCSQIIKLALRFPIADLRRTQLPKKPTAKEETSAPNPDAMTSSTAKQPTVLLARPVTMIAFRCLREQILTLHVFDFHFQTLSNPPVSNQAESSSSDLQLTIVCSQINAYYQYSKRERPIHFGIIQQKTNEPRSLMFSIKVPLENGNEDAFDDCQLLNDDKLDAGSLSNDYDSLKQKYNINVGKPNKFFNQTIKEENENDEEEARNSRDDQIFGLDSDNEADGEKDEEDDDEDGNYGPFSRIHSLISSEKNRRIVNAGNKNEMGTFISQSRANSQTVIKISLPELKCLIADQKFLNDIYNCFLNDLIMWVPAQLPPIESSLNLYDPNAAAAGFLIPPTLSYLIDSNLDSEFLTSKINMANSSDTEQDNDGKKFHMCRSAILKSPSNKSDCEDSDNCKSDDDNSKRKYKQKYDDLSSKQKQSLKSKRKKTNKNTLCIIIGIETIHLKAFVLNSLSSTSSPLKYGEFDIKTENFNLCIALSESQKTDPVSSQKSKKKSKSSHKAKEHSEKSSSGAYKIENQYISIFTDSINISHSTKTCPANVTQLKYPTNYASFENLFQMSKTKELITANDPSVIKSLFSPSDPNQSASSSSLNQTLIAPMVSIGIKSKFNTKTNTKQLLVALNFNNLSLHHLFCAQPDYWIFQLIQLFDLIDIDIVGYEVPIVLTELHLNVSNSCILYKPLYLPTHSLIAFKSLHWSSNVTAESTLTLLVFNIEDIYLFLSKIASASTCQYQHQQSLIKENEETSGGNKPYEPINLKRDYICIANSDLFELRLLINDEQKFNDPNTSQKAELKSPLLDIKIRSNSIQLRTCVDSAFALIELINYIVSDGDLHQLSPIMSEFMANNSMTPQTPSLMPSIESQEQSVADELSSAIGTTETSSAYKPMNTNISTLTKAINIASAQAQTAATFTIGTPPPSTSFKSSSSSASLSQQQFYSPAKNSSSSQVNTAPSSFLPSPSLSFNYKAIVQLQNTSSSAESIISDMVKEAMNPMTQSVMGSLEPMKTNKNELAVAGGRKRNTSLTLPSPDLQTKRMLSRNESDLISSNSTLKALKEKSLNTNEDSDYETKTGRNIYYNDKENQNSSDESEDDDDDDESLIRSIDRNHHNRISKTKNKSSMDSDQEESSFGSSTHNKTNDDDEFQFDLPFSDLSPKVPSSKPTTASNLSYTALGEMKGSKKTGSAQRQLQFDKNNRRLYFRTNHDSNDEDEDNGNNEDNDDDDNENDLLSDFDIIDVVPGFGEPPRNNQEFEIKILKNKSTQHQSASKNQAHRSYPVGTPTIELKEDHFKKPLTKIDVLKAPDTYPCPLNVYCVQEISINWCLYGGSDFGDTSRASSNVDITDSVSPQNKEARTKMNRTVSSPIIVNSTQLGISPSTVYFPNRSRNNSTSSNSLSLSPHSYTQQHMVQSPPKQTVASSPSSIKFSSKSASVNFSKEKCVQRKAGGRIISKYDTNGLTWIARGGKERNLDVCMEIALHKVKTKIDLYTDETIKPENESPLLYRVALAIGDIEIRDKLTTSAFNMFLFRYESEQCPKHTNSNMIFLKFLCSKSMDAQRLLECDIKLSIQPLRFNIDQDALIFMVEFFSNMGKKDLNEFRKTLVPPPAPPTQLAETPVPESSASNNISSPQTASQAPQEVFIRNFIFAPDLLVKFDFSGKYDKRPDNKMDKLTKILMVAVQLSNTEIKLKRICYRRGFLGAEKLVQALLKEWIGDIQRNQMKNLIKGWGIFNSLIQFFEGFTYLIWCPIEQYRKDGRVLCGIQKGSAAFSTCTVLATIELTNRMFQATKNVAEFFYDLVTPHRANSHYHHNLNLLGYGSSSALVETLLTGVGNNRNVRLRRQPNDIREGFTNAYYVMYEGINDTAANFMQEINQGGEHKGLPGMIGGALRQLPSAALAPIVLGSEATCNILSGIRNQLKPDEKKDDDRKWKTINN